MNTSIKKTALLSFLLFLPVMGFTDETTFLEIQGLLKDGLNKNYDLIQQKASFLNPSEKLFLLDVHEKSMAMPFAVNLLVGFGIGSYIQGDTVGGTIQLAGQVAGAAALLSGIIVGNLFAVPAVAEDIEAGHEGGDYEDHTIEQQAGIALLVTGVALSYGFRLYGLISPFVYGSMYNKKLKNALRYYSVTIAPSIGVNRKGEVTAALSIKL
jgi:hypothetical protein